MADFEYGGDASADISFGGGDALKAVLTPPVTTGVATEKEFAHTPLDATSGWGATDTAADEAAAVGWGATETAADDAAAAGWGTETVAEVVEEPVVQDGLTEYIVADHRKVQQMYTQYKSSEEDPTVEQLPREARQLMVYTLIREMSMHNAAEEEVLYPVVELAMGKEKADKFIEDHVKMKELLEDLNTWIKVDDVRFDTTLEELMTDMLAHATEEEAMLLELKAMPGVDFPEIGRQFLMAKTHVPTRPRPELPTRGPGLVEAHASVAALDHAADLERCRREAAGQRSVDDAWPRLVPRCDGVLPA